MNSWENTVVIQAIKKKDSVLGVKFGEAEWADLR